MKKTLEQRRNHKPVPRNMSRPTKRTIWLKYYLDETNPATFLNKVGSVKAAGYKCNGEPSCAALGCENFTYHKEIIGKWLDENGLSEAALKIKLLSLMDVSEKKYFSAPVKDEAGIVTHIHIESKTVPAIETQRRTLDMSLKVRGLYKPVLHEVAGKNGKKIEVEHALDASWKELMSIVTGDNTETLPNETE